jgi:hypothetical protein
MNVYIEHNIHVLIEKIDEYVLQRVGAVLWFPREHFYEYHKQFFKIHEYESCKIHERT